MTTERGTVPALKINADGAKFPLGELVSTPGAVKAVSRDELAFALSRHIKADWGDIDQDEWEDNDFALANGLRLLSVYRTKAGERFWVITEADRSVSTVLLPDDY